jgi:lipid II:glycine glycyltransferase (peptidoglycan interpeptide bridge formation enzyme)
VSWNFQDAGEGIGLMPAATYFFHSLDLQPGIDEVFASLDKDSVQRRIRRAKRAGLIEKCGNSLELLRAFYPLFVTTRSRHHLPPIPFSWFRNLMESQGQALEIRVAYEKQAPIAAILTLRFRDVAYYKYGCSNAELNKFGAMPWLLWNAVCSAKLRGASSFDMGRTEDDNPGLLAFKNHWVPQPKLLTYWRFPDIGSLDSPAGWKLRTAKRIFSCMPDSLLSITGKLIYRHIG